MPRNFSIVWQDASKLKSESKLKDQSATPNLIKNIIKKSNEIRDQTIVIKLPSVIIENDDLLTNFAENVLLINNCGAKIIIVHDHTKLIGDTLQVLGFDEKFIDNIRVIDHKSLQITEMILSGYINKLIVSKLCSLGCNAIGISGKDANLIQANSAKILRKAASSKSSVVDVGFTSEPIMINPEILLSFEENNIIPIISPIASDDKGRTHLLDANLTTMVISSAIDADHLMLMSNKLNKKSFKVKDVKTLYNTLDSDYFDKDATHLIDAVADSIENSVNVVHFINAEIHDAILMSIFDNDSND